VHARTPFFKRKPPSDSDPAEFDDPYFGRLRLDKQAGWIGTRLFPPVGRNVEFALGHVSGGPSEGQREFFQQIEERYQALVAQYRAELLGNGKPFTDNSSTLAFFDSLRLQFIQLPVLEDRMGDGVYDRPG
jgi:hypothetical protein